MAVAGQNKNSSHLKRGYNSPNGPGGTEEQPIVVEEDEVVGAGHAGEPTGHENRRSSAPDARDIDQDTAMADGESESDVSAEAVSANQASDGPSAPDEAGARGDRQSMPSADADPVEQGDANATEQSSPNTSQDSLEAELLDALEAADTDDGSQEGADQSRVREDSRESSHNDSAAVASVANSTMRPKSIVDEQPAASHASDESSVDEQES